MTADERTEALLDLIECRTPIRAAAARMRQFSWDSDHVPVVLTRDHVIRVLDRYLADDISGGEVEEWADALESRDDIGFEPGAADVLRQVLFALANPLLTAPLQPAQARRAKELLAGSG